MCEIKKLVNDDLKSMYKVLMINRKIKFPNLIFTFRFLSRHFSSHHKIPAEYLCEYS